MGREKEKYFIFFYGFNGIICFYTLLQAVSNGIESLCPQIETAA